MILDKIVEATGIRLEKLKSEISLEEIKSLAKNSKNPFIFEKALKTKDMAFICEVKRASPSKGIIANDDFDHVRIAKDYEAAGATAISVLTEPDFFMGSNEYLKEIRKNVNIPILRKDFIIDEYQIYESGMIHANAILLICSILNSDTIRKYIEIADSVGLSCLVEAHNAIEVQTAMDAKARIIGVNNRNLNTFEVDINNSIHLRSLVPQNIIFISESGISTAEDIEKLQKNGTNGVLIGETLMKSKDKRGELNKLRGKSNG